MMTIHVAKLLRGLSMKKNKKNFKLMVNMILAVVFLGFTGQYIQAHEGNTLNTASEKEESSVFVETPAYEFLTNLTGRKISIENQYGFPVEAQVENSILMLINQGGYEQALDMIIEDNLIVGSEY